MPYSRDRTVEAVSSYYRFLQRLYLDEDLVQWPPPEGWPEITEDSLADLDKDSTVIDLLKHLPYVQETALGNDPRCIGLDTYAVQYNDVARIQHSLGYGSRYGRIEPHNYHDEGEGLPPHVFCLGMLVHRDASFLLIDTKEGTVMWGGFVKSWTSLPQGTVHSDVAGDADSDSDPFDWVQGYPRWPVEDFFELWKEKFRRCEWVAQDDERISERNPDGTFDDEDDHQLQLILQNAGWPGDGEGHGWDREKARSEWYDYQDLHQG